MKKLLSLAIALGALAAACAPPTTINILPSGGGEGGTGGSAGSGEAGSIGQGSGGIGGSELVETGHSFYVSQVHPSLIATCGGCHNPDGQVGAPAFLDYDAELSYPMTKTYPNALKDPAESILITKEPHTGPALSDAQKTLVGTWIQMELAEAGGGSTTTTTTGSGGGETVTLEGMLAEFGACMEYDFWESSGMVDFPLQQTNGDGPCMSCHNTGAGAVWLSADPLETFDMNTQFPYVMRLVKPIYEGSDPVDLVPSDRFFNKGKEPCQNPPVCHPTFELTPENKAALENFVGTTLAKWKSGQCVKP